MVTTSDESYDRFNPKIQDQRPEDWFKLSRSIEQPRFVSTTGSTLTNLGSIIESGVKGADEAVKAGIRQAATEFDPVKDAYINHVAGIRKSILDTAGTSTAVATPAAPQGGDPQRNITMMRGEAAETLLPQAGMSIPQGLKGIGDRLKMMGEARATGNLTQTQYQMEKLAFLKDVRASWPVGYRSYIDSEVHKVTDEPIANQYLASAVQDINSYMTLSRHERDKILNKALSASDHDPSIVPLIMGFKAGKISEGRLLMESSLILSQSHQIALDTARLANMKAHESNSKDLAESIANRKFGMMSTSTLSNTLEAEGFTADEKGFETALTSDPAKAQSLANRFEASIPALQASMRNYLRTTIPKGTGNPNNDNLEVLLGPERTQRLIDNYSALPKQWVTSLTSKEAGAVSYWTNREKEKQGAFNAGLMNEPTVASDIRLYDFLRQHTGDQGVASVARQISKTVDGLRNNPNVKAYVESKGWYGATNTPDPRSGNAPSIKKETEFLRDRGINDANATDAIVKQIEAIKDPAIPVETKVNNVQRAFAPANYGFIKQLQADGRLPITARLIGPEMTAAVKKLGGPSWETYKAWADTTVKNELVIPSIQNLNDLGRDPQFDILFHQGDTTKLPFFEQRFKETTTNPYAKATNVVAAQPLPSFLFERNIKTINESIGHMAHIARAEGRDINAYIMAMFKQHGYRGDFSNDAIKAIDASRIKPTKPSVIEE